jgi:hypothetical protein
MNRLTEGLIWASAGAGLGYLLARRNLEIEFQKRLNLQIDNAQDYYRRKYERELALFKKGVVQHTVKDAEELEEVFQETSEPEEEQEPESIIADAGLSSTMTNYQGMFKGEMAPSEHVVVERGPTVERDTEIQKVETPEETPLPSKNPDNLPVEISAEAYFDNQSGFKQISNTYYAGDDILASAMNKVVPDSIRRLMLGDDMIEKLRMGLEGTEVFYVRNEQTKVDYEVFREPDSYSDVVGPIGSVE